MLLINEYELKMTVLFRNKELRKSINELNQSKKKMKAINYCSYVLESSNFNSIDLLTWQEKEFTKALKVIKDLEREIQSSIFEAINPNNEESDSELQESDSELQEAKRDLIKDHIKLALERLEKDFLKLWKINKETQK